MFLSFSWQENECNCYSTRMVNLVEQSEAHVIVLFLGLLLLLLLLGGLSSRSRGSTASSRSATSGGGSADSGAHVGDQGLQVSGLESLGEEAGPVGLNIDTSSLEDGGDLLGGDGNIVVSEDEGGVDASELRVGHFKRFDAVSLEDLAQN